MVYKRKGLEVEAEPYESNKGLEDGFELFRDIIVNGWINTDSLVQIRRSDGLIICPFISNKRGRSFIGNGDYIIRESDGERHVCGAEKFFDRFVKLS